MARKTRYLSLALGALAGTGAALAYARYLRPRMLTWGALPEEIFLEFPGDALLPAPRLETTQSINIYTTPYRVWPWLVQMGQGRGGFYTYDFLENIAGLNIHNADRVLAMYQDLHVGDTIPLAPNGFGPKVAVLDENRALVLQGDTRQDSGEVGAAMRPGDYLAISWGFYLYDVGEGVTRLVQRIRMDWAPTPLNALLYKLILEPVTAIMAHGMLQGIRDRAEGRIVWETAGSEKIRPDTSAGLEVGVKADEQRQPGDQYAGNTQPNPAGTGEDPGAQRPDHS